MFSRIIGIILRPFAGIIRYGALKIMKRFRAPDDKRPVIAASDHILNEMVLPSVFRTFQENRFRELASFKKLPVSEHDRIFNELEVAGICLAIFYLRAIKSAQPKDYHFWQDTEEHLPKQLQRTLMSYGVASSNAKLMRELIDIRREEYEKIAEHVWDASTHYKPEFRDLPPEMKIFAARVQAAAVCATDHIRRGKISENDPLIKYLVNWLMLLHKKIRKFVNNL
ncbi:hypothetical protein COY31_02405 [Candidatus Wolfebacteria bacterium CG_4_10_14_0_2_um_filter_39_18]|uniref:Uncharacterized protein n=1 Tax=Candidatus Wolfebacteria bacterium CG_4_10_14_0_2_um_filter_39_18 TaxID=1975061 RepID=A0A2M7TFB4_9BACT|nr:MAG: hypothetical protein COY31_02405 [Candidatus Wolfebacteria bacterium CG_4_10_14_0_2_um_filter_39_18]